MGNSLPNHGRLVFVTADEKHCALQWENLHINPRLMIFTPPGQNVTEIAVLLIEGAKARLKRDHEIYDMSIVTRVDNLHDINLNPYMRELAEVSQKKIEAVLAEAQSTARKFDRFEAVHPSHLPSNDMVRAWYNAPDIARSPIRCEPRKGDTYKPTSALLEYLANPIFPLTASMVGTMLEHDATMPRLSTRGFE